jgi:hypothetical protein
MMAWLYWTPVLAIEGFAMLFVWALCRAGRDR